MAIAHVDCDAFYASVEKRDHAELRDRPLIIGGLGPRAVVSTACYIARTFGVRSAMPMARARALCPEAVVLPPDMAKYSAVGREVRARMGALTPLVEPLSIDEAFLDLTGCEGANGAGAAETLVRFARRIEDELGVSVSIGLSYCKFLAKMASDLDKPRGFAAVRREDARAWLAPQSVGRLWGVGKSGSRRLEEAGFRTIGDLQRGGEWDVAARLGEDGRRLWRLASGIDARRVDPERETKSISSETTFDTDVSDRAELMRIPLLHCDRVAARLQREAFAARVVTLKLRLPDFSLRTRPRRHGADATCATPFRGRPRPARQPARGRGLPPLGGGRLRPRAGRTADEDDLIGSEGDREKFREAAIASLRDKIGPAAVQRGLAFRPGPRTK